MAQRTNNWNAAKTKILSILNGNLPFEKAKPQIEEIIKSLNFGIDLSEYEFSYNACGYPWWATHKRIKSDSFMLRSILAEDFDSETFETEYRCPCCMKPASHSD